MADRDTYRNADGTTGTREVRGRDETGALGVAERMKKTDLAAASKKAGGADEMPKPGPGEDHSSPAYRERLAAYRRSRGAAVSSMLKKP
jgi:hypothetical protein